ncbi:MAG TPA: EamA family transporter, partial [Porphyromonadaceae bacterium]|nr:EamA family transporter [Porphyromonadaceae bacterium]
ESLSLKKILGVLLGGAGAIWVTLSHGAEIGGGDVLGDIFVILSCFSYSIYIVLVKNIASRYQPVTIAKWMALFALLYMFPLGIGDLRECKFFYQILPCEAYFSLFFILVFVSGIANLCIPYSLKNLKSTTVTSYNYFIPIIASFTSIVIGQDFFSWNKLLAGIMVFMGVLFVNQSKEKV